MCCYTHIWMRRGRANERRDAAEQTGAQNSQKFCSPVLRAIFHVLEYFSKKHFKIMKFLQF